jgi:hypothetical protein
MARRPLREGPVTTADSSLWRFPWGCPRRALPGTLPSWSPDFPRDQGPAVIQPSARAGAYAGSGGGSSPDRPLLQGRVRPETGRGAMVAEASGGDIWASLKAGASEVCGTALRKVSGQRAVGGIFGAARPGAEAQAEGGEPDIGRGVGIADAGQAGVERGGVGGGRRWRARPPGLAAPASASRNAGRGRICGRAPCRNGR